MQKLLVFDFDDTLWPLNEIATSLLGIDYNKITTFICDDNPNLTKEEKMALNAMYKSVELWKHVVLDEEADTLMELETDNVKVCINSNCSSPEVMAYKEEMLSPLLRIPKNQIFLKLGSRKKEMIPGTFTFMDDSPHNIYDSIASYNIVPSKPWNADLTNVYRCKNVKEAKDIIKQIIKYENL